MTLTEEEIIHNIKLSIPKGRKGEERELSYLCKRMKRNEVQAVDFLTNREMINIFSRKISLWK